MTAGCRVAILSPDAMLARRDAWADLVGRCLEANVFSEPAFLTPAIHHLADGRQPVFIAVCQGSDERLIGLCAVRRSRLWGAPAALWTHPQATAALPVLDRDAAAAALEAILNAVAALPGRPAGLLLQGLPLGGPTARVLEALEDHTVAMLDRRSRAVLPATGAQTGLSPKAAKEARRQGSRLGDMGEVAFVSHRTTPDVAEALGAFLALETRGWKGRRGTALAQHGATSSFAQAAVAGLAAEGKVRIDGLMLAGEPIAMAILLRSGDRGFYWKTAFDETLARLSPGVQLTIRLTEAQRQEPDLSVTDSCAVEGHAMIDRIWRDRMIVADCLIATGAGRALAFGRARALETSRRWMRSALKKARRAGMKRVSKWKKP